jgi:hypothetical protein
MLFQGLLEIKLPATGAGREAARRQPPATSASRKTQKCKSVFMVVQQQGTVPVTPGSLKVRKAWRVKIQARRLLKELIARS